MIFRSALLLCVAKSARSQMAEALAGTPSMPNAALASMAADQEPVLLGGD
jgi:uncharacterized protein (DUF2336 family)